MGLLYSITMFFVTRNRFKVVLDGLDHRFSSYGHTHVTRVTKLLPKFDFWIEKNIIHFGMFIHLKVNDSLPLSNN